MTTMHSAEEVAARIAALNDRYRTTLGANDGGLTLLPDLAALSRSLKHAILERVRHFIASADDDPFDERDHGTIRYAAYTIEWRIDCLDLTRTRESSDPADPLQTTRTLTVGFDDEFPPF